MQRIIPSLHPAFMSLRPCQYRLSPESWEAQRQRRLVEINHCQAPCLLLRPGLSKDQSPDVRNLGNSYLAIACPNMLGFGEMSLINRKKKGFRTSHHQLPERGLFSSAALLTLMAQTRALILLSLALPGPWMRLFCCRRGSLGPVDQMPMIVF